MCARCCRRPETEQLAHATDRRLLRRFQKGEQLVGQRVSLLRPAIGEGPQHRVRHVVSQHVRLVGFIDMGDFLLQFSATLKLAKQPLAHDRLVQTLGVVAVVRHQDSMAFEAGREGAVTVTWSETPGRLSGRLRRPGLLAAGSPWTSLATQRGSDPAGQST